MPNGKDLAKAVSRSVPTPRVGEKGVWKPPVAVQIILETAKTRAAGRTDREKSGANFLLQLQEVFLPRSDCLLQSPEVFPPRSNCILQSPEDFLPRSSCLLQSPEVFPPRSDFLLQLPEVFPPRSDCLLQSPEEFPPRSDFLLQLQEELRTISIGHSHGAKNT